MDQEKLKQAKEEIEATCNKYNITLMPVVVHQGERTFSSIEIVPRSQQSPSFTDQQVQPTISE